MHPVFHNSLVSPYKETTAHRPNFTRPPPDIIEGEDDHYEVEDILQSRPSPNKKGIQYLIKWKGYPSSKNSWLPASQMHHAKTLVQQFHSQNPHTPKPSNLRLLMAQQPLKEGILSQSDNSNESKSSRIEPVTRLGNYPDRYGPMEMTHRQAGRTFPLWIPV